MLHVPQQPRPCSSHVKRFISFLCSDTGPFPSDCVGVGVRAADEVLEPPRFPSGWFAMVMWLIMVSPLPKGPVQIKLKEGDRNAQTKFGQSPFCDTVCRLFPLLPLGVNASNGRVKERIDVLMLIACAQLEMMCRGIAHPGGVN
jgi:hypothetical protein